MAAVEFHKDRFTQCKKASDNLDAGYRYRAARAAILVSTGRGKDADRLDDAQRAGWRQQALAWLQADLALRRKQLTTSLRADRLAVLTALNHWRTHDDLLPVREPAAIDRLPETEREAWRKLWQEVDAIRKLTWPAGLQPTLP